MKIMVSIAVALALVLSVIPAVANDTFQALSKISTDEQVPLTPLADNELAAIEGANPCAGSIFAAGVANCVLTQIAVIGQNNTCALANCSNVAAIVQAP